VSKLSSSQKEMKNLRESLSKLESARAIESGESRTQALKAYYFPIPCDLYCYVLIFVNWLIAAFFAFSICRDFTNHSPTWMGILACVPVAFFIADLMSAGFHKWLDSYASESNPFWGGAARAFRIHHEFPKNLNGTTYWHNVSAFAPFLTFLYALMAIFYFSFVVSPYVSLTLWLIVILFANGTEIHKQSHIAQPAGWIRFLQKAGFFLSQRRHLEHHRGGVDSDYGIINGWSHGVLRWLGIWPKLDRFLWKHLGVFPHNWVQVPGRIPPPVLLDLSHKSHEAVQIIEVYMSAFPRPDNPFKNEKPPQQRSV
jgi:hypothetical protein